MQRVCNRTFKIVVGWQKASDRMGSIFPRLVTREEPDFAANDRCYIMDPAPKKYYEWHINDKNDTALKKAKELRQYYEGLYQPRNNLVSRTS